MPRQWNNNNPVRYSDSTGYCTDAVSCGAQLIVQSAAKALLGLTGGVATAAAGGVLTAVVAAMTPGKLADDTESGYNRDHPDVANQQHASALKALAGAGALGAEDPDVVQTGEI